MRIIRRRKPSLKTALGITGAKRRIARATGIPTTKAGRKRKALNLVTGGAYGRYQRTRANVSRPFKAVKRAARPGCLVFLAAIALVFGAVLIAAMTA